MRFHPFARLSFLSRSASYRSFPVLVSALAVLSCFAPSTLAAAQALGFAQAHLSNGDGPVTGPSWAIGDDLWVSVQGPFDEPLEIRLVDDLGEVVASEAVLTDPTGASPEILLWSRTGIVGCDESEALVAPADHSFRDLPQAEAQLADRAFVLEVRTLAGIVLVSRSLVMSPSSTARFFFSDLSGCPRFTFENDEAVYLSAVHASPGTQDTAIFLVDNQNPTTPAGLIREVRMEFMLSPQSLDSDAGAGTWTTLLWSQSGSQPGSYGAIVRYYKGITDYAHRSSDLAVGTDEDKGPHGATIMVDECTDEDCDG